MTGANHGGLGERVAHRVMCELIIHPIGFDHFVGVEELTADERGEDGDFEFSHRMMWVCGFVGKVQAAGGPSRSATSISKDSENESPAATLRSSRTDGPVECEGFPPSDAVK